MISPSSFEIRVGLETSSATIYLSIFPFFPLLVWGGSPSVLVSVALEFKLQTEFPSVIFLESLFHPFPLGCQT